MLRRHQSALTYCQGGGRDSCLDGCFQPVESFLLEEITVALSNVCLQNRITDVPVRASHGLNGQKIVLIMKWKRRKKAMILFKGGSVWKVSYWFV